MITNKPIQTREGNTEADILREARERVAVAQFGWRETFATSRDDENFIAGSQWDQETLNERDDEGRPTLVINQLQQYISRIAGAQKKQVQEIKISPVESNSQKEPTIKTVGGNDENLSSVLEGVIRNIQSISNAPAQYKTAFRHCLSGVGWLRVLTDYSRNDSFEQDIKIEAIRDRLSVLIDPHSKESDYSDAGYGFIHEQISHGEFKVRYPGKAIGNLDTTENRAFWGDNRTITVSEYFRREPVTRTLCLLSSGETVYKDDMKDVIDELEEMGVTITRERKVNTYKVIWCKITANAILEKEREFPTSTIPIVPVLGREVIVNGKRSYQGAITHAKDPQVMLNYWQSAATERISLAPKAPYIAEAGAIEGYETIWKTANTKNYSVLPYNKGFAAPKREAAPLMPIAEINMAQNMQQSIQSTIGIYDASIGKAGNETSGRAIMARQSEADTGTFDFVDSLSNAMRRVGILCVELIPKTYDTERILRIKSPDGSGDFVEINKVVMDEESGEEVVINDLAMGKYDVVITTGASYATKRMETADSILNFAQAIPQVAEVAGDLIADNMDFNNSDAIAERLKKGLPLNLLSKEDQEEIQKDAPPQQPSPQQIEAEAQAKEGELQLQLKDMEYKAKIEIEGIKLEVANINLETKRVEAGIKVDDMVNKKNDDEAKRKDDVVKDVVGKMRGAKA